MKRSVAAVLVALASMAGESCGQHTSLQDAARALDVAPETVIYTAREIVTLDPAKPQVTAVAVAGDRILATGSLEEVTAAAGPRPRVDRVFEDRVIVPGFIAQHDHPLLAALTMTSAIIAIEDWVLPDRIVPAAHGREAYLRRLAEAERALADASELLLTWGYHQSFHGPLSKADLDRISATRPIIVWHRSAHEFYLNTAAEERFAIDRTWFDGLPEAARAQSDFENGHYREQGWFAVLPKTAAAVASPARVQRGLRFVQRFFHANGVTVGAEPGGIASRKAQDAQNAVLGDAASPFRWYFIADGKSVTAFNPDGRVAAETEKFLDWGKGMTAYLPRQVKLFADGAIFSLAMQVSGGYSDGHEGAWMMEPELFARSFRVYWDLGYQIHVHVNGDAGLDMVLDRLEENLRRHPREDHRTVIVHFAVSRPEQVRRIKDLGAIVSANPYYPVGLADTYRTQGLDPERADAMVRLGDVERAGIPYSLHSDMPMAPGRPLFLMASAINRITNDGNLRGPEQRVSRLGALRAVTIDAAYSLRLEHRIGSIVPGKVANFTILAENPLTVPAGDIATISVWGTLQEGRLLPVDDAR